MRTPPRTARTNARRPAQTPELDIHIDALPACAERAAAQLRGPALDAAAGIARDAAEQALLGAAERFADALQSAAGMPDTILHGSANIAIALREVINRSFHADPTTLRRFAGQFHAMVIPGRPVTVCALEERRQSGETTVFFEMLNDAGEPAIVNGAAVAEC